MAVHLHTNRKFKHILSETLNVQFSSAAAKFLALFVRGSDKIRDLHFA